MGIFLEFTHFLPFFARMRISTPFTQFFYYDRNPHTPRYLVESLNTKREALLLGRRPKGVGAADAPAPASGLRPGVLPVLPVLLVTRFVPGFVFRDSSPGRAALDKSSVGFGKILGWVS